MRPSAARPAAAAFGSTPVLPAWEAWAGLVADRSDLEAPASGGGLRRAAITPRHEANRLRDAKLDALAEFAAGAGHELNNPLAVIVGRAQLLLGRTQDPETSRSLRIILSQAQRRTGFSAT